MDGNLIDRAWRSFEAGDYKSAIDLFSELTDRAPDSVEQAAALIGLSRCFEILGHFAEAEECLHEARNLGDQGAPEYAVWLDYQEARIDARQGRDAKALSTLDRLLEKFGTQLKSPEWVDMYERVQILRVGRLQDLNRPHEALSLFAESLGFKAKKPKDHVYRAAYCIAQCGDILQARDTVINTLKDGLDVQTECTARYYLGAIYVAGKDYAKALKELQFCEEHLDDFELSIPALMADLALVCEKLGRLEDAARYQRAK